MTVDQLIFSSLSVMWVWNRCRCSISNPAGGKTSTDLNRVRAAGGWKSGKIMIIIMETYDYFGHSLNHREKNCFADPSEWIQTDFYLKEVILDIKNCIKKRVAVLYTRFCLLLPSLLGGGLKWSAEGWVRDCKPQGRFRASGLIPRPSHCSQPGSNLGRKAASKHP